MTLKAGRRSTRLELDCADPLAEEQTCQEAKSEAGKDLSRERHTESVSVGLQSWVSVGRGADDVEATLGRLHYSPFFPTWAFAASRRSRCSVSSR